MGIINAPQAAPQAAPQGAPPGAPLGGAPSTPDQAGAPQAPPQGGQSSLPPAAVDRLRRILLAAMKIIYADPQVSRDLVDMVRGAQDPQQGLQHATSAVLERIAKAGVDQQLLQRVAKPVSALIAELVQAAEGGEAQAEPAGDATQGPASEAPHGEQPAAEPDEGTPDEEAQPDEEEEAP